MTIFVVCALAFSFGFLMASAAFYMATKKMMKRAATRANRVLIAMDRGHLLRVIDNHMEETG
jgi:hypothetical protein